MTCEGPAANQQSFQQSCIWLLPSWHSRRQMSTAKCSFWQCPPRELPLPSYCLHGGGPRTWSQNPERELVYLSELPLSEGDCTGPHSHSSVIGLQGDSPIPPNWHTNLLWGLDVARALLKPTQHTIVSSGFPSLWIPSRAVTLVSPVWGSMLPFLHMHTHTCRGRQVTAQQKFDFVLWSSISHEVPTKMELPWQYQMPFYQKHSLEFNCRNDYDNV